MVAPVTREQVLAFADSFKATLFIEGLVQGNFTAEVCVTKKTPQLFIL